MDRPKTENAANELKESMDHLITLYTIVAVILFLLTINILINTVIIKQMDRTIIEALSSQENRHED